MRSSCHFGRPSWWNPSTSMCSTAPSKLSQILATFSMFSSKSVSPGTSTNRTQIFLPAFASRRPKSMVAAAAPGDLVVGLLVARLDVEQAQVDVVDHLSV